MGEALEIAKVLVSPTMKLMDMVGSAIGTAYEPHHKRKMADASVYEINAVAEAMRNAADMPIVYNKDGVAINSEDFSRLMQRAGTRLALQETIKQHNIECVVDNAYAILEKEDLCSEEPVEQGWINRFFDSVADISDEDLQTLWGRVLAGEIKQPQSYSLRTLETLKNLSKAEAQLFQKIVPYVVNMNGGLFLPSNNELLKKYGITYSDIILLDECGLINSGGFVTANPPVSEAEPIGICTCSKIMIIHGIKPVNTKLSIGKFGLTNAGKELSCILDGNPNDEYFFEYAEEISRKHPKIIKVCIHQIINKNKYEVNYDTEVLQEFPTSIEETLDPES